MTMAVSVSGLILLKVQVQRVSLAGGGQETGVGEP